jgi:hypothetical protein
MQYSAGASIPWLMQMSQRQRQNLIITELPPVLHSRTPRTLHLW